MENSLHNVHVHKLRGILNITYTFLYILALTAILYYRGSFFFARTYNYHLIPNFLPWYIISASEFLHFFLWIFKQPMHWWPVTRTVFPEKLPKDEDLPKIDVLICTTDPNKEPTFEVMNTVISAMALDYPADKLSVYVSDDGGASVTLNGMKEAWIFAKWWLPFCSKYNVNPCPQAYFQNTESECHTKEFIEHQNIVREKYETFKQRLRSKKGRGGTGEVDRKTSSRDHPALVQVINENFVEEEAAAAADATSNREAAAADATSNREAAAKMPLLVYVAREKRPSHPHCFKAGALNALV